MFVIQIEVSEYYTTLNNAKVMISKYYMTVFIHKKIRHTLIVAWKKATEHKTRQQNSYCRSCNKHLRQGGRNMMEYL